MSKRPGILSVHKSLVSMILLRQNGVCFYCEKQILIKPRGEGSKQGKATLDHKMPLALGGLPYGDNVVAACKKCNNWKGCLDLETYLRVRDDPVARRAAIKQFEARINSQTQEERREISRFQRDNAASSLLELRIALRPVIEAYRQSLQASVEA